jgi:hypothetical protein
MRRIVAMQTVNSMARRLSLLVFQKAKKMELYVDDNDAGWARKKSTACKR